MKVKKIRIGYFADGPWSHNAFDLIMKNPNISIEFIVPRSDTKDSTLMNFSKVYNIKYLSNVNVNSNAFVEFVKNSEVDLLVSMSFNQIFKIDIINSTSFGIINCHAGKLPFYRGRNILNWVLINDENEFGITVHFVDEGIDTGDIILQKTFPITDEDDYSTLLETSYKECGIILNEALTQIASNSYQRIEQKEIDSIGFYCGQRKIGDEIIDWNQNSRDLFNFTRAICEPGPSARTYVNGDKDKEVRINKVKLIEGMIPYRGISGQVIGKSKNNYIVKTRDTCIEIVELETLSKIKIGDRFKSY